MLRSQTVIYVTWNRIYSIVTFIMWTGSAFILQSFQRSARAFHINTIHNLHTQGKSVQQIAQEVGISRTTVRKYLKHPEAVIRKPRPPRSSKLDPFKEQIKKWVMEDHCTNCEVIFAPLQQMG
jgi:helix-turn-helix resolvase-like protein